MTKKGKKKKESDRTYYPLLMASSEKTCLNIATKNFRRESHINMNFGKEINLLIEPYFHYQWESGECSDLTATRLEKGK